VVGGHDHIGSLDRLGQESLAQNGRGGKTRRQPLTEPRNYVQPARRHLSKDVHTLAQHLEPAEQAGDLRVQAPGLLRADAGVRDSLVMALLQFLPDHPVGPRVSRYRRLDRPHQAVRDSAHGRHDHHRGRPPLLLDPRHNARHVRDALAGADGRAAELHDDHGIRSAQTGGTHNRYPALACAVWTAAALQTEQLWRGPGCLAGMSRPRGDGGESAVAGATVGRL